MRCRPRAGRRRDARESAPKEVNMCKSSAIHPLLLVCIIAGSVSIGCNQREVARLQPYPDNVVAPDYPLSPNRQLDILFVVDDSFSMDAEQRSLVDNFPRFMEVLEAIEGGLPDVHIGVISTDVGTGGSSPHCDAQGDDGGLHGSPGASCQVSPPGGNFIIDVTAEDGARERNYPDGQTLADTFSCIAELGTSGCAFEQPLESMRRALDGGNPGNNGFLRENAYLAVVFITDEDDCSTADNELFSADQDVLDAEIGRRGSFRCWQHGVVCEPDEPLSEGAKSNCRVREDSPFMYGVQEYVDFIKGLKYDEELIVVAGIMGDSGPIIVERDQDRNDALDLKKSCGAVAGDPYSGAVPATRLEAFLDAFSHSTQTSICDADLSDGLLQVADLLARVLDERCLPGQIFDTDGTTEGIQPECSVTEILHPNASDPDENVLPACDNALDPDNSSRLPCYLIAPAAGCLLTPTGLAIDVYPTNRDVPVDARLSVQCVAE
jgi:hypothetical protein